MLRETEAKAGVLRRFAACFSNQRRPERVEHTISELVTQRVFGLCLGWEDLNDHDDLRHDPLRHRTGADEIALRSSARINLELRMR